MPPAAVNSVITQPWLVERTGALDRRVAPVSVADAEQSSDGGAVVELASVPTPVHGVSHVRIAVRSSRNGGTVALRRNRVVSQQIVTEHRYNTTT